MMFFQHPSVLTETRARDATLITYVTWGKKKKELNLYPGHGIIPEGPGYLGAGRGIDLNHA